jgi:hypothetical protein
MIEDPDLNYFKARVADLRSRIREAGQTKVWAGSWPGRRDPEMPARSGRRLPYAGLARISVADQVARLEAGRITLERFDFAFLRYDSGPYGRNALQLLKEKRGSPEADRVAQRASEALAWFDRGQARRDQENARRATPATRAANITVIHPKGQRFPNASSIPVGARRQGSGRCPIA